MKKIQLSIYIWKPPSLNELTKIILNMGLTHLGLDASIYTFQLKYPNQQILFFLHVQCIQLQQILRHKQDHTN